MKLNQEYTDEWNEKHFQCVSDGRSNNLSPAAHAEYRNNIMADHCEDMIVLAKKAYYDSDNPIMEDSQYDKFEDYLRILRPDSKVLQKVGN